jgi:hypothetical protein
MTPPTSPWPSLMMSMKALLVQAQGHRPSHVRIVERRGIAVDDQVAADATRRYLAN